MDIHLLMEHRIKRGCKQTYKKNVRSRHWSERVFIAPGGKPSIFFAIMMFGQPGVKLYTQSLDFQFMSVINYSGAPLFPCIFLKISRSMQMKF